MKKIVANDFFIQIDISAEKLFKEFLLLSKVNDHKFKRPVNGRQNVSNGDILFEYSIKSNGPFRFTVDSVNWKGVGVSDLEAISAMYLNDLFQDAIRELINARIIN